MRRLERLSTKHLYPECQIEVRSAFNAPEILASGRVLRSVVGLALREAKKISLKRNRIMKGRSTQ